MHDYTAILSTSLFKPVDMCRIPIWISLGIWLARPKSIVIRAKWPLAKRPKKLLGRIVQVQRVEIVIQSG